MIVSGFTALVAAVTASGTDVLKLEKFHARSQLSAVTAPSLERLHQNFDKKTFQRKTCLADKTNLPVERLSLNRSQCGSCSTKYDTSAGT